MQPVRAHRLPVFLKQMSHRRTLWTLYAVNFLNAIGLWFFLPLLPIFLGRKGASAALVGVVFAAGLITNALIRYPAGWAADRYGTRPVMLASMSAVAVLFLAFLLPLPPTAFIVVRLLQGCAIGAYWPAANGLLADVTEPKERGKAFGTMQSTFLAGMVIAPGVGGFIALFNFNVVFAVAAATSVVAAVALWTLPNVRVKAAVEVPKHALHIARNLLPLIMLGAGTSYMIGTYDTIWPLYMTYRGANTFAVGLSFVVFALPAVLLSTYAGSLGDRFGPRRFIVVALVATGFFAALYPFIASVPWLIGLGLIEGFFTISGQPSLMAEVSRTAELGHQARTQGVFQTMQTLIQIVGAVAGGALFTLSPTFSFLAITAVCVLGAGIALVPSIAHARQATETP
jgi:DHA1 family quinolone resistance protein-like MFS transporter